MIKDCIILDGKLINIGPWDYQMQQVEVSPAEYDEDGNIAKEAVYEEQTMNPLPEGATVEQRDFEYDEDRGWYEIGTSVALTTEERLKATEDAIVALMGV